MTKLPFFLACVLLTACDSGDGHANYSLKVVLESNGKVLSTACPQAGSSTGASGSVRITGEPWIEIAVDEDGGGTMYEVELHSPSNAVIGNWRYDESMARQGTIIDSPARDEERSFRVRIRGVYGAIERCDPDL